MQYSRNSIAYGCAQAESTNIDLNGHMRRVYQYPETENHAAVPDPMMWNTETPAAIRRGKVDHVVQITVHKYADKAIHNVLTRRLALVPVREVEAVGPGIVGGSLARVNVDMPDRIDGVASGPTLAPGLFQEGVMIVSPETEPVHQLVRLVLAGNCGVCQDLYVRLASLIQDFRMT